MIFASSFVMAGTAVDDPDEFDAMEMALDDEPDEPDEDNALVFGLKGDGCPVDREDGGVVSISEVSIFAGG